MTRKEKKAKAAERRTELFKQIRDKCAECMQEGMNSHDALKETSVWVKQEMACDPPNAHMWSTSFDSFLRAVKALVAAKVAKQEQAKEKNSDG